MKLGIKIAEMLVNCYIEFQMLIFESILGSIVPDNDEEKKQIINITLNNEDLLLNQLEKISSQTTYKRTAESFKKIILCSARVERCACREKWSAQAARTDREGMMIQFVEWNCKKSQIKEIRH